MLKGYYLIGGRINQDYMKFGCYEYGGFTQEDLAKELGVDRSAISRTYQWHKMIDERYGSFDEFVNQFTNLPTWKEVMQRWLPYEKMLDEDFDPDAEPKLQSLKFPESKFINEQAARQFFQQYGGELLGRFYIGKVNPELYEKKEKTTEPTAKSTFFDAPSIIKGKGEFVGE